MFNIREYLKISFMEQIILLVNAVIVFITLIAVGILFGVQLSNVLSNKTSIENMEVDNVKRAIKQGRVDPRVIILLFGYKG
jgi:hypothetical protein